VKPNILASATGLAVILSVASACAGVERSITIPQGAITHRLAPGHYEFILPNKQIVEVAGLSADSGSCALLRVIAVSTAKKSVLWGGRRGRIFGFKRLSAQEFSRAKSGEFAAVDTANVALPLSISVEELSGEDLLSEFLKLNVNDPSQGESTDADLVGVAKQERENALQEAEKSHPPGIKIGIKAPSDLTASVGYAYNSPTLNVLLTWKDNSPPSGFVVERRDPGQSDYHELRFPAGTTSVDGGLSPGTYYYRVRAFHHDKNTNQPLWSGYSNEVSARIPAR